MSKTDWESNNTWAYLKGKTMRHPIAMKTLEWPDPTEAMLASPEFNAVWNCIKTWDIAVPEAYGGYCGATGNHVRAILDALASLERSPCEQSQSN